MNLKAAPARLGLWLDTDMRVSGELAQKLRAGCAELDGKRVEGLIRYVAFAGQTNRGDDITHRELVWLMEHGLQVMLVQHCRYPGWLPSWHLGAADGERAASIAESVLYPPEGTLYLDLEGIGDVLEATLVSDYANAWAAFVERPGCYHGFSVPLSPAELYYWLHRFRTYWTDAANRSVDVRGNALRQGRAVHVDGVEFDLDELAPDELGQVPFACEAG
jgi:hypothetical protein